MEVSLIESIAVGHMHGAADGLVTLSSSPPTLRHPHAPIPRQSPPPPLLSRKLHIALGDQ